MNPTMIIRRPILTEKTLAPSGESKRYTFEVDRRATKPQVAQAVEEQFGVSVTAVTTTVRKGKTRRQLRRRGVVSIPPMKKATVTLRPNQVIDVLEVKE